MYNFSTLKFACRRPKNSKKTPFFRFEKYTYSAFTGKKINVIATLFNFLSLFKVVPFPIAWSGVARPYPLASLRLPKIESISKFTTKLSKIAMTLIFFPVKAENVNFSNMKKGVFLEFSWIYILVWILNKKIHFQKDISYFKV